MSMVTSSLRHEGYLRNLDIFHRHLLKFIIKPLGNFSCMHLKCLVPLERAHCLLETSLNDICN